MQSEVVPLNEEKPESVVWWKLHLYIDSLFFLFMFFAIVVLPHSVQDPQYLSPGKLVRSLFLFLILSLYFLLLD